jgi:hypothetical protein
VSCGAILYSIALRIAMIAEACESRRTHRIEGICLVTLRTASTIRGTREARWAAVCVSIRIASDYWVADTFNADVSGRALFISTGGIADAVVAYKSVWAFSNLSRSSVWISRANWTADTTDALHTGWTI